MNYAKIKKFDISNGPGVRVSLFVSGCTHQCKGCFNKEAWDFCYGQPFTEETENEILEALKPDFIRGFSLLGGEPFDPRNQGRLLPFVRRVREMYPQKTIWCYTGYLYDEELLGDSPAHTEYTLPLLQLIDVLVDGVFVEELKNLNVRFRGSTNQRIIDVPHSLMEQRTVVLDMDSGRG
ncbi:MAG: anaerobic ribonucleoside-triphosphate reductase activating protein [Oscillospiraceae bacterium]|nr:anaerobic ribonucleoside-triphosphate reductase activating protein [Oscillospiraceae bacterium]